MRHAIVALTLALGLSAGASLPSKAATVNFGSFGSGSYTRSLSDTVAGSFDDIYNFSLMSPAELSASITNSYTSTTGPITNFTLSLFSTTSSTALATIVAGDSPAAKLQSGGFSSFDFAGDYFLRVTGTATAASYGGSLALQVSAVPLPPALPMFGASLLAMLGLGYGMKRFRSETRKTAAF